MKYVSTYNVSKYKFINSTCVFLHCRLPFLTGTQQYGMIQTSARFVHMPHEAMSYDRTIPPTPYNGAFFPPRAPKTMRADSVAVGHKSPLLLVSIFLVKFRPYKH